MKRPIYSVIYISLAMFVAQASPLLLRKPALSKTQIVFSYAGDLWSVPREGGEAKRLTTGAGNETDPMFSPDGTMIAFTGEYDGNQDVFVMPAAGGVPKRLTWHPADDAAIGWTPDGKRILFCSSRATAADGAKFFTVAMEGGFPEELPLPIALEGSYSPDGKRLAYVPLFQWQDAWKRYRGGQTRRIWLANLADSKVTPIPRENNANDFNPMWVGSTVYFLSDRGGGPVSLFAYDSETKKAKRLLENHGLDLKSASAGPGAIVYEQFGALCLYDLASGKSKAVEVRLAGDLPEVRPHFVNVAKSLKLADISPNGARAVFEARGDIVTVPAEKGDARNLTNSPGVHEREPVWSPDGKTIAYFSDESGEYALHLREQNGMGAVVKISLSDHPGFYSVPRWSPDSKKIAYLDSHAHIWYVNVTQKKPVLVETDYYASGKEHAPSWSPDSKWLAYSQKLKSHMTAIWLYALADGKKTQVTDGMSEVLSPVFDQNGKYLYFTVSTDSGSAMEFDLHSLTRSVSRSIYVVVLPKDDASPLAPESDDEKIEQEKKDNAKADEKKAAAEPVAVKIDLDNIGQRILALPMPAKRYAWIEPAKAGVLLAVEENLRVPRQDMSYTVHRFDMAKRRADIVIGGVRSYRTAAKGEKYIYQQGDKWAIVSFKPMPDSATAPPAAPPAGDEGVLKTQDLEVHVDPRAEWNDMYHEVWRIERDFFYDPRYHGLDLKAVEKRYEPYLENLGSRRDLNYIFSESLGELTVGHMFIHGGDTPEVKRVQTGLLGADYKLENGRYRFAHIYNGENWNPDLKAPLTQPGVNVAEGDYLLAVNGRDVRASDEVYRFFEGTAGKATVLNVGPDAVGTGARTVTVVPLESENRIRNLAWIEGNRRKVDQMTNGRVAYIYMPDTALDGLTSFNRYFFAQTGKEAAIIDERFNHGGELASDIVEYLSRKPLAVGTTRDGADQVFPLGGIYGPKVMIINEFAGSGGDALPWLFRRAGLGKLVGKRTWGGLVGIDQVPELIDGGGVTSPNFGIWNVSGEYDVENRGIPPDIEVELDPAAVRQGHDPQLEKAVEVVMSEMAKNPAPVLKRPPFPNYQKARGW